MSRVIVTGGAGMLGLSVVQSLRDLGIEPISVTRREVDLSDGAATKQFFNGLQADGLIHCAAVVGGIKANIDGGSLFLTKNLEIDNSVLYAAADARIKHLIYVGSSCMYPANRQEKLRESDILSGPLEPTNEPYALAKIVGSRLANALGEQNGLNWKTIMASNLYGPGDHFNSTKSHLLASIISKVAKAKVDGSHEIEMWGDGSPRREFTYVTDFSAWLAQSILRLDSFPALVNAGLGIDYSVKEFYELALKALNFDATIVANPSMPSGNARKLMDSSLARSLGWNPRTGVEEGITKTARWYETHGENK